MTKDKIIDELNHIDNMIEDLLEVVEDAKDDLKYYIQKRDECEEILDKLEEEDEDV